MSFLDKTNEVLNRLQRNTEEWNSKSERWLDETRIKSAAQEVIKTNNFSSEAEKRIMLEAAENERQRKRELAAELAVDPTLAKYFHEALERIGPRIPDPETVQSIRIAEEEAMKFALEEKERQVEIDRQGPEFRKLYEKHLAETEAAIRKNGS